MLTRLILTSLALCSFIFGQDVAPTGFFYPRSANLGPYAGFLDASCGNDNNYLPNMFHIGKDSWGFVGQPVYAIADGWVVYKSLHGWIYNDPTAAGDGISSNVALLIKHQTTSGFWVQAVYGHIHTTLNAGDLVKAGTQIGTLGAYGGLEHVHFGVRVPLNADASDLPVHFGNAYCCEWPLPNQDRWIDPVQFIQNQKPKNGATVPGPVQTGNITITFSPNPVLRSSDGAWYYTVYLQETNGVAVSLAQMQIGGTDYSNNIGQWFGTTTVAAHGQLSVNIKSWGSTGSLMWQFSSSTTNWAASINLQ